MTLDFKNTCRICRDLQDVFCDENGREYTTKDHFTLIRTYKDDFTCPKCYERTMVCSFCNKSILYENVEGTTIEKDYTTIFCNKCYNELHCWECENCYDTFCGDYIAGHANYILGNLCKECLQNKNKRLDVQDKVKEEAIENYKKYLETKELQSPSLIKIRRRKTIIECIYKIDEYSVYPQLLTDLLPIYIQHSNLPSISINFDIQNLNFGTNN